MTTSTPIFTAIVPGIARYWHRAYDPREQARHLRLMDQLYLHRSLKPLVEVDFRNASDFGQLDAFADECEGMCGV